MYRSVERGRAHTKRMESGTDKISVIGKRYTMRRVKKKKILHAEELPVTCLHHTYSP